MSESIAVDHPTTPKPPPTIWRVSDELWQQIQPIIPPLPPKKKSGRPRVEDRIVLDGIIYVLRTGCQWKKVSKEFSSGSTCHLRFSEWVQAGVFAQMWALLLTRYDELHGIEWEGQSMDAALGKAPGVPKKGHRTRPLAPILPTAPSPE
jgi:putative transposase